MVNTEIIYKALESDFNGDLKGSCCVCGRYTEKGFKTKDYIKNARFTNFDLLKNVGSDVICEYCAYCIGNADLRRKSFIADSNYIKFLSKNDIETLIFDLESYVAGEFVVCITQSFKKHNSFKATVNTDTSNFSVQLEDNSFYIDTVVHKELYNTLNKMYLWFGKDEIKNGDYSYLAIKDFGADIFTKCENEIKQYRGSMVFDFLLYILNSERRNEIVKERLKAKKEAKKLSKKKKEVKTNGYVRF